MAPHCWGENGTGQLGNANTAANHFTPTAVTDLTEALRVSGGGFHSCAVLTGGRIRCWGENADGQLGNTDNTLSPAAVVVTGF